MVLCVKNEIRKLFNIIQCLREIYADTGLNAAVVVATPLTMIMLRFEEDSAIHIVFLCTLFASFAFNFHFLPRDDTPSLPIFYSMMLMLSCACHCFAHIPCLFAVNIHICGNTLNAPEAFISTQII